MSYPYLLATLPPLNFRDPAPVQQTGFIELCQNILPDSAISEITQILGGKTTKHLIVERYFGYEKSLDHEIVQLRARKLGRSVPLSLDSMPEAPVAEAEEVMRAHNPREAEQVRLYALWSKLKQLSATQYLNFEALAIYALQLRLLLRKERFQDDPGRATLLSLARLVLPAQYITPRAEENP